MLTQDKKDKFFSIAKDLYVKEYMGVDGIGTDMEFENELTDAVANYLISIFYDKESVVDKKKALMEKINHKSPKHPSNIFNILV